VQCRSILTDTQVNTRSSQLSNALWLFAGDWWRLFEICYWYRQYTKNCHW